MNPWVILGFVLAVGAAAGGGYYQGNEAGKAKVQQQWDKEKAEQYAAYAKGQEEARRREQEMQEAADKLRKEKDRETRELTARNAALVNSLRDRPERPTEVGAVRNAPGAGSSGCTPRELYRQDSEVVVGLAREADEVLIALKQCYAQYEAVRDKLKGSK
jgi:hypothetical protein